MPRRRPTSISPPPSSAEDVGERLQANPKVGPEQALAAGYPRSMPLQHRQRVYLSNAAGAIIASFPDNDTKGSIGEHLGAAQPLTVFAEKAGVMRLTLPAPATRSWPRFAPCPSPSGRLRCSIRWTTC